ncbi:unnamed protein product [Owenia fusiformis]|uniref:Uncharacterized protein n=1 Tax=Owenia fusiformis TaxID=6347 RepID=A0A8J1XXS6_OWEFU|nr:unnamed protein product [Owenia fusiformis]
MAKQATLFQSWGNTANTTKKDSNKVHNDDPNDFNDDDDDDALLARAMEESLKEAELQREQQRQIDSLLYNANKEPQASTSGVGAHIKDTKCSKDDNVRSLKQSASFSKPKEKNKLEFLTPNRKGTKGIKQSHVPSKNQPISSLFTSVKSDPQQNSNEISGKNIDAFDLTNIDFNDDINDDFNDNIDDDEVSTVEPPCTLDTTQIEDLPGFDKSAGHIWIYPTNYPVRIYQFNIVKQALFKNTLVTLPTGLGKTFIAAVVMYNYYRWYPQGKIIFMAPTKPLVAQQIEACYNIMGIPPDDTAEMTGAMNISKRKDCWGSKRVFFLTPQVLTNDLTRGMCPAEDVKCLVADEAHKAQGNYAYCQVVKELSKYTKNCRILALSATPGSDIKAVQQVINNLLISCIELRTEDSLDIQPYTHERKVEKVVIRLDDELKAVKEQYMKVLTVYIERLTRLGVLYKKDPGSYAKFPLIQAREQFRVNPPDRIKSYQKGIVEGDFALLISLYHGFELLTLHGSRSLYIFLKGNLEGEKSNRMRTELTKNADFNELYEKLTQKYKPQDLPDDTQRPSQLADYVKGHPKLAKLQSIVLEHFQSAADGTSSVDLSRTRIMIFSQYRDSVAEIKDMLNRHRPLVKVMSFIGQSSGKSTKGFSQKEQLKVMREFREGGYNTLVSTCVGEEGLDIGDVDLIICFDAHKSPIRLVQRMGRTGRKREGRIIMLMTEGKEEAIYNQSQYSKRTIHKAILNGKKSLKYNMNTPHMIPDGLNPKPHKMYITVDKTYRAGSKGLKVTEKKAQKTISGLIGAKGKGKRSKADVESPFLNDEELAYWHNHLRVDNPEETPHLTATSRMLTLPPYNQNGGEDGTMEGTIEMTLSLNEWMPWQNQLQPTYRSGHSIKSNHLVELIQFAELQASIGEDVDHYGMEMATFLDEDDIIRPDTQRGIMKYCTGAKNKSAESPKTHKNKRLSDKLAALNSDSQSDSDNEFPAFNTKTNQNISNEKHTDIDQNEKQKDLSDENSRGLTEEVLTIKRKTAKKRRSSDALNRSFIRLIEEDDTGDFMEDDTNTNNNDFKDTGDPPKCITNSDTIQNLNRVKQNIKPVKHAKLSKSPTGEDKDISLSQFFPSFTPHNPFRSNPSADNKSNLCSESKECAVKTPPAIEDLDIAMETLDNRNNLSQVDFLDLVDVWDEQIDTTTIEPNSKRKSFEIGLSKDSKETSKIGKGDAFHAPKRKASICSDPLKLSTSVPLEDVSMGVDDTIDELNDPIDEVTHPMDDYLNNLNDDIDSPTDDISHIHNNSSDELINQNDAVLDDDVTTVETDEVNKKPLFKSIMNTTKSSDTSVTPAKSSKSIYSAKNDKDTGIVQTESAQVRPKDIGISFDMTGFDEDWSADSDILNKPIDSHDEVQFDNKCKNHTLQTSTPVSKVSNKEKSLRKSLASKLSSKKESLGKNDRRSESKENAHNISQPYIHESHASFFDEDPDDLIFAAMATPGAQAKKSNLRKTPNGKSQLDTTQISFTQALACVHSSLETDNESFVEQPGQLRNIKENTPLKSNTRSQKCEPKNSDNIGNVSMKLTSDDSNYTMDDDQPIFDLGFDLGDDKPKFDLGFDLSDLDDDDDDIIPPSPPSSTQPFSQKSFRSTSHNNSQNSITEVKNEKPKVKRKVNTKISVEPLKLNIPSYEFDLVANSSESEALISPSLIQPKQKQTTQNPYKMNQDQCTTNKLMSKLSLKRKSASPKDEVKDMEDKKLKLSESFLQNELDVAKQLNMDVSMEMFQNEIKIPEKFLKPRMASPTIFTSVQSSQGFNNSPPIAIVSPQTRTAILNHDYIESESEPKSPIFYQSQMKEHEVSKCDALVHDGLDVHMKAPLAEPHVPQVETVDSDTEMTDSDSPIFQSQVKKKGISPPIGKVVPMERTSSDSEDDEIVAVRRKKVAVLMSPDTPDVSMHQHSVRRDVTVCDSPMDTPIRPVAIKGKSQRQLVSDEDDTPVRGVRKPLVRTLDLSHTSDDDDFEDVWQTSRKEINASSVTDIPFKTKKSKHSAAARGFLDTEAELSGDDISTDDDLDEYDELDSSFINDECSQSQALSQENVDNRAMYLKSVRSPLLGPGKYKLRYQENPDMDVFSQVAPQDETYAEDSFCVANDHEITDVISDPDTPKVLGKRNRKNTRLENKFSKLKEAKNVRQQKNRIVYQVNSSSDEEETADGNDGIASTKMMPPISRTNIANIKPDYDDFKMPSLISRCSNRMKNDKKSESMRNACTLTNNKSHIQPLNSIKDKKAVITNKEREERLKKQKEAQVAFQQKYREKQRLSQEQSETSKCENVAVNYIGSTNTGTCQSITRTSHNITQTQSVYQTPLLTGSITSPGTASTRNRDKPLVFVDSRELASGQDIVSALRCEHKLNAVVCQLVGCDYIVSNRMGIERKIWSDFTNGSNKQKLVDRMCHLSELFERPVLILEKDRLKPGEEKHTRQLFRTKYTDTMLAHLSQSRVKVFYSDSQEETSKIIADIVHMEKRKNQHVNVPETLTTKREQLMKFYMSLPKINYVTALNLSHNYRTLRDFMQSSVPVIQERGHLSQSKALEIYQYIRHEFNMQMVPSAK